MGTIVILQGIPSFYLYAGAAFVFVSVYIIVRSLMLLIKWAAYRRLKKYVFRMLKKRFLKQLKP